MKIRVTVDMQHVENGSPGSVQITELEAVIRACMAAIVKRYDGRVDSIELFSNMDTIGVYTMQRTINIANEEKST